MIPVLAQNHEEYRDFIRLNHLSENKYFYLTGPEQLYGIARGSMLLMVEGFMNNPHIEIFNKLARTRNMDCIRVY